MSDMQKFYEEMNAGQTNDETLLNQLAQLRELNLETVVEIEEAAADLAWTVWPE